MFKKILHAILLAFGGAMLLFIAGFAGWQLGLAWLAAGLYALAARILWLAFGALAVLQIVWVLLAVWRGVAQYFRREAMALRRVVMLQICRRDAGQRQLLEIRQMHYRSQLKRQRLLIANDKKHSGELFDAINGELRGATSPATYKALRKTLKQHYKRADAQAMLALRERVLCPTSSAG